MILFNTIATTTATVNKLLLLLLLLKHEHIHVVFASGVVLKAVAFEIQSGRRLTANESVSGWVSE